MMKNQFQSVRFTILSTLVCFTIFCAPSSLIAQKKKTVTKVAVTKAEPVKIVSYELLENGDTINRLDSKHIQHGRWVVDHEAEYDEPATMEVGTFDNGVRTGAWKTYTATGELVLEENYKKGLKNGEARYYENGFLICVGNYLALNSTHEYDTILVENPATNEFKEVRVKTETGSVKHGLWTFYEVPTKRIRRVIEYQADEVVYDKNYNLMSKSDSTYILSRTSSFPHVTKKPDENIWTNKSGQKRIKYTDLPDNANYIKPNVKKK